MSTRLNPNIDILGILLTRFDGRNVSLNEAVLADLDATYGDAVLEQRVGINTSLAKAQMEGKDVFAYDDRSRGAEHYAAAAQAIAAQLAH